jgi:hypothetical protein
MSVRRHRNVSIVAILALAFAYALPATALEAKEGLFKIVANEANGRVSFFRLVDIAKGRYEPFLFDQDARTTFVTLSMDGRQAKLGDASEYRISVSRTDTGVILEFRSSSCVVREALDFAKSEGAALADGVRVTFELENVSERDSLMGIRFLADTFLAEKSGLHFATDKNQRIQSETALTPESGETWLSTPGERASLMIQFAGVGFDRPDRIILANWKRLADVPWGFDVNPQRNFSLVPYSINDSAAALFWEPVSVPRGGVRRLSFALGEFNEKGYPAVSGRSPTDSIFETTVLKGEAADPQTALAADLVAVRDLVSQIDRAISAGVVRPEEVAAWNKILDRLEERKKGY